MLSVVFAPPLLHGITWSKCSSLFDPHWRQRPPSLAATSIFTSCAMTRLLGSPTGAAGLGAEMDDGSGSWPRDTRVSRCGPETRLRPGERRSRLNHFLRDIPSPTGFSFFSARTLSAVASATE
jgi:hypothetical protein